MPFYLTREQDDFNKIPELHGAPDKKIPALGGVDAHKKTDLVISFSF